jgi:hypothetical protein
LHHNLTIALVEEEVETRLRFRSIIDCQENAIAFRDAEIVARSRFKIKMIVTEVRSHDGNEGGKNKRLQ